jgi:Cu2+-exporting ATPase
LSVFQSTNRPGFGVNGIVEGRRYWLGNRALIESETGLNPPDDSRSGPGSRIYLADESTVLCRFVLSDVVRRDSAETIAALRDRGVSVALLSGDNRNVAEDVAHRLGIEEVVAECSPSAKLEYVKSLQAAGETVAMVGDGVNDAPVLAGADVSISAGGASAIAVASADVVALSGDLLPVVTAYDTSVRTVRILRQNLGWAIGYNVLAIPAAATGVVTPWLAALGMSLSSLLVVANAAHVAEFLAGGRERRAPSSRT